MKTYYESVDVTIDLNTLEVTTSSNLLKHFASRIKLDPMANDIDTVVIPAIMNQWLPSDRCSAYFENSDEVTATRSGAQLTFKVAKGQDTLSFQFDTENNVVVMTGTTLIRMTRITIVGGEDSDDLAALIEDTLPLFIGSVLELPIRDGVAVKTVKG